MPSTFVRAIAFGVFVITGAASAYEPVGNVVSWTKSPRGLRLECADRQAVQIDILTERLFRLRFSVDGAFPASRLIDEWRLVRPNDDFPATPFEAREEENVIWVTTAQIRLKLQTVPFRIGVYDRENRLLTKETASEGMAGGGGVRLQMDKAADERFFGLGVGIGTLNPAAPFKYFTYPQYGNVSVHGTQLEESEITLDQTGKKTFFCVGPSWGQCMTPAVIPFFMSTRGYGIYLNDFRDSVFDLGCTDPDVWSVSLGGPPNNVPDCDSLDYYFLYGPSFKTILDSYTDLTGRTPLVPKWSLGYFQICDFNQTQAEVLRIAQDFRERDFPCDTLLLEPGWTKTPYRMDGWSAERFPNPDAMIADLRTLDFKLGLWQCGPAHWVFTSWDLLKNHINQWGVDITNPADVETYKAYHRPYYRQGIRFFKQDGCGQSEWNPDEVYHNGLTGREMHNAIPALYSKIMHEAYREHSGLRPLNFNPMVGPSQQRYPGIWPSGDAGGGYVHFRGEMNLGLSGHSYTTHDFTDRSPAGIHWSLLGPWCPGGLSSLPQGGIPGIHVSYNAPENAAAISDMCQFYLKLRYRLIPYIYNSHRQASLTGVPYMRAMVLEYQNDPVSYGLDRQCMLGDWFLLAAYTKDVYLPAGMWIDYWTGETIESKGEWKRDRGWPEAAGGALFVKGGAIVPMGPVTASVDKEPLEIVMLDVYPHGNSAYTFYEDDGTTYDYEGGARTTTEFQCRQQANEIQIAIGARQGAYGNMPKNRTYLLSVHCQTEPETILKGAETLPRHATRNALVGDGACKGWYYDSEKRIAWIKPMAGWYYGADERGTDDPEKDTVYWVDSEKHEEQGYDLWIRQPIQGN